MNGMNCGGKAKKPMGMKKGGMAKMFAGKESGKEEKMERKMPPAMYNKMEKMEKKSSSPKRMAGGGIAQATMKAKGRNMAKAKAKA